ncbi:MAG: TIGR03943 family protein, partial [Synechococcaceae bacterium LLD_019]|nr:TIGR03943 family protein [Synechococcaceae bacterium LLD_019]
MKYLVLGFLGATLLKCWLDQRLNLLLNSNFHSLVLIAGLVLLIIAIAGFYS